VSNQRECSGESCDYDEHINTWRIMVFPRAKALPSSAGVSKLKLSISREDDCAALMRPIVLPNLLNANQNVSDRDLRIIGAFTHFEFCGRRREGGAARHVSGADGSDKDSYSCPIDSCPH
jgi:hypothetical protein